MKLNKWMSVVALLVVGTAGFCQSALYNALWDGPKAVRKAIEKGANVNAFVLGSRTALMFAAGICDARIAQELLNAGADISLQDERGRTAIMYWADSKCDDKIVLKVLSSFQGDAVNIQDKDGNTALFYALEQPNMTRVKELVQNGARLDVFNRNGENAVIFAAKKNPELVRQITHSARQLDEALFITAYTHNLPAVKGLLRAGANPSFRLSAQEANSLLDRSLGDRSEWINGVQNALIAAAGAPRWAPDNGDLVIQEIYNAGGTQGKQEAFFASIHNHRPAALRALLQLGVNIYDDSFVYDASAWRVASMMSTLRGSPYYEVQRRRKGEVVSLLLQAGLPVDQRDTSRGMNEETPLMLFVQGDDHCASTEAVRTLLKGGANKNKRNNKGISAYDLAVCSEYKELLKPDNADRTSNQRKASASRSSRPANRAKRR